jgi:hypothetical protein
MRLRGRMSGSEASTKEETERKAEIDQTGNRRDTAAHLR